MATSDSCNETWDNLVPILSPLSDTNNSPSLGNRSPRSAPPLFLHLSYSLSVYTTERDSNGVEEGRHEGGEKVMEKEGSLKETRVPLCLSKTFIILACCLDFIFTF